MRSALLGMSLVVVACFLTGCATPYSVYQDERKFERYVDDEALALNIKAQLARKDIAEGFDISVYALRGHIYLVGAAPDPFRAKALKMTREYPGVKAVTAHWFDNPGSFADNKALEMSISGALIEAKNVSSTQVELDVSNGQVVVVGLVADKAAADRIIKIIRGVAGVKSVSSYIQFPPAKQKQAPPVTL